MIEPAAGRTLVILTFCYCVIASFAWYRIQPVPTLIIPVVVSALPLIATGARQGVTLRVVSGSILSFFVIIGGFSAGPTFAPAALAMFVAYGRGRKGLGVS